MSATHDGAVEGGPVIVTPKKPAEQMKFRWDPKLIDEIREIATRTHRTINEAGELLMRWAVQRAKAELEMGGSELSHEGSELSHRKGRKDQ